MITWRNWSFSLISNMVSNLLHQLQIFWELCLIIARAFNRIGATQAVALDISKAFNRVLYPGLLHKLKYFGNSGLVFGLISSFLKNIQLRVVLNGKSSQEYPVNAGVPQGSIHGPPRFLLYIIDLSDDLMLSVILLSMLMILLSTLSVGRRPSIHLIHDNI